MKRWMAIGLAAMAVALTAPMARAADDAEATYQTLLTAARANPATTDWQALRFAYAARPSFTPAGTNDGRRAMITAYQAKDWPGLLSAAQHLISDDYVDGSAHLMASFALNALNRSSEADPEQAIAVDIFKSIMAGHDGSSPDQAFVVISVAEEYELMSARKRHVVSQSLVNRDGHAYDVLVANAVEGGDSKTFYFLIDRVLEAENKALGLPH